MDHSVAIVCEAKNPTSLGSSCVACTQDSAPPSFRRWTVAPTWREVLCVFVTGKSDALSELFSVLVPLRTELEITASPRSDQVSNYWCYDPSRVVRAKYSRRDWHSKRTGGPYLLPVFMGIIRRVGNRLNRASMHARHWQSCRLKPMDAKCTQVKMQRRF